MNETAPDSQEAERIRQTLILRRSEDRRRVDEFLLYLDEMALSRKRVVALLRNQGGSGESDLSERPLCRQPRQTAATTIKTPTSDQRPSVGTSKRWTRRRGWRRRQRLRWQREDLQLQNDSWHRAKDAKERDKALKKNGIAREMGAHQFSFFNRGYSKKIIGTIGNSYSGADLIVRRDSTEYT